MRGCHPLFKARLSSSRFGTPPVPHPLLFLISTSLKVELNMQNKDRTETLGVGSSVPDFSLPAANREGRFSLGGFLERGPLILEFLRGTW